MPNPLIRKQVEGKFNDKQDALEGMPATLGDGTGTVIVPGIFNYVYVQLNGGVSIASYTPGSIPLDEGTPVLVIEDPYQTGIYKIHDTRSGGSFYQQQMNLMRHHQQHEWGGGDEVFFNLKQFMPLKVSPVDAFTIRVSPANIWIEKTFTQIPEQDLDLVDYLPSAGKARLVMVTINTSGSVVLASGSEVDTATLGPANMPDIPTGTYLILGAVRLFDGQLNIAEAYTTTDIDDERFPHFHTHTAATVNTGTGLLPDHAHAGVAGDGNRFPLTNLLSTGALLGQIPVANGSGAVTWESLAASEIRYFAVYNHYIGDSTVTYTIGLATSSDTYHWTIRVDPVIPHGTGGDWDSVTHQYPKLLEVDGKIYLYYAGKDTTAWARFQIGLAISEDGGTTWTKKGVVLDNTPAWDDHLVFSPVVIDDREDPDTTRRFKMWFAGASFGTGIGYAYSADGLSFTPGATNPVMTLGSGWESDYIGPHAVIRRGDQYVLFYGGKTGAMWQNGIATFTDPEGTYTRGPNNPVLGGDGIVATLTADLTSGSAVATVDDSSVFPIGCPVWVGYTTRFLTHVIAINSPTSIQLADEAPATIATGQTIRSIAFNSVDITGVMFDAGYRFTIVPHQPDGGTELGVHETTMWGYADIDLEKVYIDYGAGLQIPITVAESQHASVSRENWSVLDLHEDSKRFAPALPGGTVTSITAGTGLSGGTIVASGTIALANTAVTPGAYIDPVITIDQQGRITAAHEGSGGGEVLMQEGVTAPPVPITNEDQDDWLFEG